MCHPDQRSRPEPCVTLNEVKDLFLLLIPPDRIIALRQSEESPQKGELFLPPFAVILRSAATKDPSSPFLVPNSSTAMAAANVF
jgi:hypothetical protein